MHVPVMTADVLQQLRPERGGVFVDCTIGFGGHARALLEAGATRLIGLDRDLRALAHARDTLAAFAARVPGAEWAVVPGAAHGIFTDRPDESVALLRG